MGRKIAPSSYPAMHSSPPLAATCLFSVLLLAGCRDLITSPDNKPGVALRGEFQCAIRPAAGTVLCNAPEQTAKAGPARNVIVGGQGTYVNLQVGATNWNAAGRQFSMDIAIENLTQHPFATADGEAPHASGTRLFLARPLTHGAALLNPDGTASFTAAGQEYIQYPGIIEPGDTTAARTWTFGVPPGVEVFYATFYVWTTVENPAANLLIPPLGAAGTIAAGAAYTCARRNDGLYCWGLNEHSQLGDGTTASRYSPVPVTGGGTFTRVGVGLQHTCALDPEGVAYCWGDGQTGRLGIDADLLGGSVATPTQVAGTVRFLSISPGASHTCAVALDGSAWCWGYGLSGELGTGSNETSGVPVPVAGGKTFKQISAGASFSCAVDLAGAAWCWGNNDYGTLGNGTFEMPSNVPVPVAGSHTFRSVSAGTQHACGVTTSSEVWCWGDNEGMQLGNGTETPSTVPVHASAAGQTFVEVRASFSTCALSVAGDVYCAGPTGMELAASGLGFVSLALGIEHRCGLTGGGDVYCWGNGTVGRLGDGTRLNAAEPQWPVYFGPSIASLVVTPDPVSVAVGGSTTPSIHGLTGGGAEVHGLRFEWTTNDAAVATVSQAGQVGGVALGSTTLKAMRFNSALADSVRALPVVNVVAPYDKTIISGDGQSGAPGAALALPLVLRITHTGSGNPAPGITVTFSGDGATNPTSDATDSNGYVEATWTLGGTIGPQTMQATSDAGTVFFAAMSGNATPARVEISPASHTFESPGDSLEFAAAVYNSENDLLPDATITWSSTDTNVATVTSAGIVTAVADGLALIVAQSGSVADTASVTVTSTPPGGIAGVTVAPGYFTLYHVSEQRQLTATAHDAGGQPVAASFAWSSTDEAVATVDGNGLVTAIGEGIAQIVALTGAFADTATVTVQLPTVGTTQGEILYVSESSVGTGVVTAINIPYPSGIQAGDLLIASVTSKSGENIYDTGGWTPIAAASNLQLTLGNEVFYRFADGTETGSATFTIFFAHRMAGGMVAYRNVSESNPIIAVGKASDNTASIVVPSINVPGAARLVAFLADGRSETIPVPTSMTQRYSVASTGGTTATDRHQHLAADQVWSGGGATGMRTSLTASVDRWVSAVIALRPKSTTADVLTFSVTGSDQVGEASMQLAQPVTITVTNGGSPVVGAEVTWTPSGNGTLQNTVTTTNGSGQASTNWTLAGTVGSQTLGVLVQGNTIAIPATALAGAQARIAVTPGSHTFVKVGDSLQFGATVYDDMDDPLPGAVINWQSTNTSVATVGANGLVHSVGDGMTLLIASSGTVSDTATVSVSRVIDRIEVLPGSNTLDGIGAVTQYSATAYDAYDDPIPLTFTWTSSDPNIATITSSGIAVSASHGATRIIASAGGFSGSAPLFVHLQANITFKEGGSVVASSGALTAEQGDLVIVSAMQQGSTTAPTLPAGFTQINTVASGGGGSNIASRTGYVVAGAAGRTSTGTWTNATHLSWVVLSTTDPTTPIGASATQTLNNTTTNIVYPSLTLQNPHGGSRLVLFAGRNVADAAVGFTVSNFTVRGRAPENPNTVVQLSNDRWPNLGFESTGFNMVGPTSSKYYTTVIEVLLPIGAVLPASPVPTPTTVTSTEVTIEISGGANATALQVHRSTVDGFTPTGGTLVGTLGTAPQTFLDSGLSPATTYYYRVIATNAYGTARSWQVSVTTPAAP
jgi:alpha-tubulin suppressor-like RCC1 family protein